MVTMNSEKSACRRKPIEKTSSSSSSKKTPEHVDDTDKRNEDDRADDSPDLSPNTPTFNVTASCAEDTPNYLVYKKVLPRVKSKTLQYKFNFFKLFIFNLAGMPPFSFFFL